MLGKGLQVGRVPRGPGLHQRAQRAVSGQGFLGWDREAMRLPGMGPNALVPRPSPTGDRRSGSCAVGSSMGWWSWRRSVPCAMTQRWTTMRWDPALFCDLTSVRVPRTDRSPRVSKLPGLAVPAPLECHTPGTLPPLNTPTAPPFAHWL